MNNLERLKKLEEVKDTLTKKQYSEIKRAVERELCKENLAYLVTEVLDPEYYKPILADFHYEMMRFAESNETRKLILVPRGHLKSSLVTIPLIIQTLLKNPNARILLTNATLDNSQGFLRSIKGYLEGNEKLRHLFGEFVSPKWNEGEIIIKQRNKKQIKESSVTTSSVDKSIVSQHFDMIIGDDLVNRESINTREQLQKTKLYYKDLLDLLDPQGNLILIGTRWHYDDLYQYILDNSDFAVFFRTCWASPDKKTTIFPKVFNLEYLEHLRKEKGIYEFSSQYENNPVDDENAKFKESWFKYFKELDPEKTYNYYLTIDTAGGGEGKHGDGNGWVLNAVDSQDNWYLEIASTDRLNTTGIIDRIFALNSLYPSLVLGMEKTMFTNAFKPYLEKEMSRKGVYLHIEEFKHITTSKENRILGLVPYFERHKIFLKEGQDELKDQAMRFPKGKHDDILDALCMQKEIAKRPNEADYIYDTDEYQRIQENRLAYQREAII